MLKTNKALVVLVALLSVFLLSPAAFAANAQTSGGATMTIGGTGGEELEMNFSPNVSAYYGDDESGTSVQWYVISTFHSGGNKTFATAQNVTSVYYKTGDTSFDTLITTEASMDEWSTAWSR